ncbi:MAG: DNA primase [Castellaniella sp.]|uniref:DNA primase n=1 Tax=Castellaniella sp. TaxID=1955812 RepID=UPI0012211ED7|nr:DNA primase [Castellaniella sp.]TAN26641.1 MAG: DNA primase [Castellaniella sp.]
MIPESFIQELLARVDIVDVVGRYVQLRKGGANLLGLCPFHTEKTPSFTVSPTKQFYHCFGCGAHGSALRFLTEHTGASFPEAVRTLAAGVGMTVPEEPRTPRQKAAERERREEGSRQQQILEQAQAHYRASLKQAPDAIAYLKRRGLSGEIAARFGLGWAGSDRRGLASLFSHYEDPALLESGLVIEAEDGRRHDRFRSRIMFPIRNSRGKLVGFGGRLIEAGEPKYLNSPETPLFSKGNELYGLHEARGGIHTEGCVLVVEGYMDVVALAQFGLTNAVATLGTSTTANHIQKLRRASDRIVFSFDGDNAGRKAAWRALQACLPWVAEDVSMRFLFLPQEHDPDSYIRAYGAQALRACLDEAIPLSRFMLDEMAARHDLAEAEGRAACVHEARPLFAQMPEGGYRLQVEREFAQRVRLTPEELSRMLAQDPDPHRFAPSPAAGGVGGSGDVASGAAFSGVPIAARGSTPHDGSGVYADEPAWMRTQGLEGAIPAGRAASGRQRPGRRSAARLVTPMARRLLRLLLAHPDLVVRLGDQQLELLARHPHLTLVSDLVRLVSRCGATHAGALLEAADPDSDLAHAIQDLSTELLVHDLPDPQAEWDDALRVLERQAVQEQCDRLIQGGLTTDGERRRYQELSRRLARLKAAAG